MSELTFDLEIGKPVPYGRMRANDVLRRSRDYLRNSGIDDPQLVTWTDPPNPGENACTVYLMRVDGLDQNEIDRLKREHVPVMRAVHSFKFEPTKWNEQFPPDKRTQRAPPGKIPKATKIGWENMQVGSRVVVRMHTRDVKVFLAQAYIQRGIDAAFECTRLPYLEEDKRNAVTVWNVQRIR